MANIDRFFEALEKEGLTGGRITIAGSEYRFPKEGEINRDPRARSIITFARALRYSSLLIILVLVGYILINLLMENGPKPNTQLPENVSETGGVQVVEQGNESAQTPGEVETGNESAQTPGETEAGNESRERVLAGVTFTPVAGDDYSFSYISQKIFLKKIRPKGTDVRLVLNDIIDRVNSEASRTRLNALVLTPRFTTNRHLLALWLDGYLEEGQIFLSHQEGAVLVKKITAGVVEFDRISDWEALSKKKDVFVRIILKKAED